MNLIRRNTNAFPANTIFDDFFGKDWLDLKGGSFLNFSVPAVNIKETTDNFLIEMAVPGMKKNDFKIEVDHDVMTIASEQKDQKTENEGNYSRKEFSFKSFKRSFTIPKDIDSDGINATYVDGILNVALPKKEEAKAKPARLVEIG